MSSDRQRLVNSIRRIALTPEERRQLLGDSANRGDQAGAGAKAASQGEQERICCDGSTAPPNAGSEERDPDADGAGQDASGGLDSDNPASLDMGGGSLVGVKDCATGEPICFAGSDWVPPEGWDSPTDPPLSATYDEGLYWQHADDPATRSATRSGSAGLWGADVCGVNCDGEYTCAKLSPDSSGTPVDCSTEIGDDRGTVIDGVRYSLSTYTTLFGQYSCASTPEADYCNPDESDIREDAWPADGCINLAIKGGKLVASKYDPEAQGTSYLVGAEEYALCDDFGNSFTLSASGSSPGGWKTIDSTNNDGYLYDSTGTQIARISGSEYSDPAI